VTEQTLGHRRVRATFNPSANSLVDVIKVKSAEMVDFCETLRTMPGLSPEQAKECGRLCSLAQTSYEEAAMWAVKAATTV